MDFKDLIGKAPELVSVLLAIKMFLDDRKRDRALWENHLTKSIEVQRQNAEAQTKVATLLDILIRREENR